MANTRVCPWQEGKLLTLSARRLIHNPQRIIAPYVNEGFTVLDIGCGMGYFTIPMAEMATDTGKVIAADVQQEMLDGMLVHAERAGVRQRIEPRLCGTDSMNMKDLCGQVHFILLFMVLHEVPGQERFVEEIRDMLKPGGKLLFAEPIVHVSKRAFVRSINTIRRKGFTPAETPRIALCRAMLFERA